MSDIVQRLRAALLDRDNFPYMDSETHVRVGLAREAADEIERLQARLAHIADIAHAGGPQFAAKSDALAARLAEAEAAVKTWEREAERRSRRYEKAAVKLAEAMFILEVCVPILIDSCKQHDKGAIQRWDEARGTRWPRAADSADEVQP